MYKRLMYGEKEGGGGGGGGGEQLLHFPINARKNFFFFLLWYLVFEILDINATKTSSQDCNRS